VFQSPERNQKREREREREVEFLHKDVLLHPGRVQRSLLVDDDGKPQGSPRVSQELSSAALDVSGIKLDANRSKDESPMHPPTGLTLKSDTR